MQPFVDRGDLELWFSTNFRGHILWALDRDHLDYLARFVASTNRARDFPSHAGSRQLADKLPSWMVSAKNRPGVLDALARLRERE